jgi:hypothetical protein
VKQCLSIALAVVIITLLGLTLFGGCSAPSPELEAKAAIIDQLYSLQPNQVFISNVTQQLEAFGFAVDLYQGNEITVDLYRQLPGYGYSLIIFRAHSGLIGSEGEIIRRTCLFTNEPYSETKHVTEQLTDQLAKARIDEHHPWVFGIGDKFVTQSMEGQFTNAVIIMMGCSTLYLEDLAQAFIDKGASTYMGWDAAVGLDYVDEAAPILVTNLYSKGMTIKEAVDATMAVNGPDPDYGAFLKYYPIDSGNKTIRAFIRQAN